MDPCGLRHKARAEDLRLSQITDRLWVQVPPALAL